MTVRIEKPAVNVREKLAELDKPTGIAGEAMLRAETPQEQFNLIGAGRRNMIINGDFQVSQRGDYSSSTSVTSGNYYVDRWAITTTNVTANMIHSIVTLPNGVKTKSLKVTATSSNTGYLEVRQIIEDYLQISGQELIWSAWVRTNMALIGFRHNGHTDFGSKFPNDGEWHYVTSRYTMDEPSSGSGADTAFSIISYNNAPVSISSGDYFEIAQVQLEVGKVATPFEHRSYGEELALCQRYFYKWVANHPYNNVGIGVGSGTYGVATNQAMVTFYLPTRMRASPSVGYGGNFRIYSFRDSAQSSINSIYLHRANEYTPGLMFVANGSFNNASAWSVECGADNDGSAYVTFESEL